MKITGSPTKRKSANAIKPTASITRIAWPSRRRMKAAIGSARMVTDAFCTKADPLAEAPWPPRPAVAGHHGPLSHLAVGSDAAADAGLDRHPVLPSLPREISDRALARGGERRGSARA